MLQQEGGVVVEQIIRPTGLLDPQVEVRPVAHQVDDLLAEIRDRTSKVPHAYFGWTEGNPIAYLLKFLAFGEGDVAPVSREVLRQTEPDPEQRPRIHLG